MTLIFIVAVAVVLWGIGWRNEFEELRRSIRAELSNISIYTEKRADCLNDMLSIANISYKNEIAGLQQLTAGDQLKQLVAMGQAYPTLQTSAAYQEQMRQAIILQQDIAAARALLNGNIQSYNNAITRFPGLIVASMFGYKEEKFIDEENMEANRRLKKREVDFTQF